MNPNLQTQTKSKVGILLVLLSLSLNLALWQPATTQAQTPGKFFPETGFTVSGKFLDYWLANGGLPVYGYPISEAKPEIDPETGKTFLTQWFERNRFELHPENAGSKYEVLLGLLGKDLRRATLQIDPDFQPAAPLPGSATNVFFKETAHNLSNGFLTYWQNNGGLERFGYPISELREEVDPETGKVFKMQWFERARFEYHPENAGSPYEVLLGLLGKQIRTPTSKIEFSWKKLFPQKSTVNNAPTFTGMVAADKQGNFYIVTDEPVVKTTISERDLVLYNKTTVQRFDAQGKLTLTIDTTQKNANFNTTSLAVDEQGNIYVAQYGFAPIPTGIVRGMVIKKFDANGQSVLSVDPGGPPEPVQIALDRHGNIYVANSGGSFYLLDPAGKRVTSPVDTKCNVGNIAVAAEGIIYLTCDKLIKKYDANGNMLGQRVTSGLYKNLGALAVDGQGNLYVLSNDGTTGNSSQRITKFDSTGTIILVEWNTGIGSANGQFNAPGKIAVDGKNNLYIADTGNLRLQMFRQP